MKLKYLFNNFWIVPKTKVSEFVKSSNFSLIKKFFQNSLIFLLFSFLNVSLPIFICLISSRVDDKSAYGTIGVGFITSFQLAFSQIGFTFAIFSSCLILKRDKVLKSTLSKVESITYDVLLMSLIYGLIITPLYVGPSYVYNMYANKHYNTIDSLQPANYYIYSSSGFVLLTTLSWTFIFLIYNKTNSWHALLQILISFGSTLLLSSTLGLLTNLKYIGVGLGLTIGTLISCISSFIHCWFKTDYFKHNKISIKWIHIKLVISNVWRQTLMVVSIQVFKAIALLVLNLQVPEKLVDSVPLNYQMARLIWYNFLYLIPFVILGFSDSIYYFFIKHNKEIEKANVNLLIAIVTFIALFLTIIVAISSSFLTNPLVSFYIENQNYSYDLEYIKSNVSALSKTTIIEFINKSNKIPLEVKDEILAILNSQDPNTSYLVNLVLKNVTEYVLIPKFSQFGANEISSMIILPDSYTLLYVSVYCILYPLGTLLNSFLMSIKKEKPPAILMVIAQAIAIAFVVEFGINFQETQRFYLMEAWSFPLAIIGIVAFIYLSTSFFIKLHKKEKVIFENFVTN